MATSKVYFVPFVSTATKPSPGYPFAVQALRVKHIVVLGHARCGGIRAFADETAPLSPGDFIGRWMSMIAPAGERLGPRGDMELSEYVTRLEFAAIEHSLRNLMTFPCVKILVERGKLQLHGAYFGVANGVLLVRDPQDGAFKPAVENMPERVSMFSAQEVKG